MTFQDSVMTCLSKYAVFSGRASLSEFWWFFLFQILVSLVLTALVRSPIPDLAMCLLFCPSIAVGARRLHDTATTPRRIDASNSMRTTWYWATTASWCATKDMANCRWTSASEGETCMKGL